MAFFDLPGSFTKRLAVALETRCFFATFANSTIYDHGGKDPFEPPPVFNELANTGTGKRNSGRIDNATFNNAEGSRLEAGIEARNFAISEVIAFNSISTTGWRM
ncbi:MAG: hypothetical protein WAN12_06510 [Candidatus Acidiferrum sp.]